MASSCPKQMTLSSGSMPISFICWMANRTVFSLWEATMMPIFFSCPLFFSSLMRRRHSVSVLWYISDVASKFGFVGSGYPKAAALALSYIQTITIISKLSSLSKKKIPGLDKRLAPVWRRSRSSDAWPAPGRW